MIRAGSRWWLAILLLAPACAEPAEQQPAELAPETIGDELLRVEGTWASPGCASSHLYREGRRVQYHCFDAEGQFSWENRGALSTEASAAMDAALMAAQLDGTEPVNYMGLCDSSDAHGTVTMWVGEQSVSFAPFCLFEGIVPLYEEIFAVVDDIAGCQEPFTKLESVEPGCRA